jgi:hypothetical protein
VGRRETAAALSGRPLRAPAEGVKPLPYIRASHPNEPLVPMETIGA